MMNNNISSRSSSSSSSSSWTEKLIPVGIDVGSLHARIAILQPSTSLSNATENDTTSQRNIQDHSHPVIITNEMGDRYTLAVSAEEPEYNDSEKDEFYGHEQPQYDGNTNSSQKNKKKNTSNQNSNNIKSNFIFGDAARRFLQSQKLSFQQSSIRSLILNPNRTNAETESPIDSHMTENPVIRAFFSHLMTQTMNSTSVHPSALRIVIAVPTRQDSQQDQNHSHSHSISQDRILTRNFIHYAQEGLIQCIREVGWDNHPMWTFSPTNSSNPNHHAASNHKESSTTKIQHWNKKEKKQFIHDLEVKVPRILGVLTEPMAICVAHGLLEEVSTSTSTTTTTTATTIMSWKYCMVIDWGASSLKVSILHQFTPFLDSTNETLNKNSLITILSSHAYTHLSGQQTIVSLLMDHVATNFERSKRLPLGTVLQNKKSYQRLEYAVEEAIRTFCKSTSSSSTQALIAIDGLYDGMDCNMNIASSRFDMLLEPIVMDAESLLRQEYSSLLEHKMKDERKNHKCSTLKEDEIEGTIVILSSGCYVSHPLISCMIDRVFPPSQFHRRGKGREIVPPEDAVAMGCAIHASKLMSAMNSIDLGSHDTISPSHDSHHGHTINHPHPRPHMKTYHQFLEHLPSQHVYHHEPEETNIVLSPVCIGLSLGWKNIWSETMPMILIDQGTPLPAFVLRTIPLTEGDDHSLEKNPTRTMGIVQILNHDMDAHQIEGKLLCELHVTDTSSGNFELLLELTRNGTLHVSVNGEPPIVL